MITTSVGPGAVIANYADAGESSGSFLNNPVLFPAIVAKVGPGSPVFIQFGASIKGFEPMVNKTTTDGQYRKSFVLTGMNSVVSGAFGMVPYAPYVSSLGFLQSTRIYQTIPMIIGAAMFLVLGLVPVLSQLFTTMPVSVGNAVLFVPICNYLAELYLI